MMQQSYLCEPTALMERGEEDDIDGCHLVGDLNRTGYEYANRVYGIDGCSPSITAPERPPLIDIFYEE